MKLDLLFEDIFRVLKHPTELSISVNTSERGHRSSDRESISTVTPYPLRATTSKTRGVRVFYAFSYKASDEITDLLKGMKGKNELTADPRQMTKFFHDTVTYVANGLKINKVKPDIIVSPESSSDMANIFAKELANVMGAKVVTAAFVKQRAFKLPTDKLEAFKFINDNFIDHDLIAAKYHGDDVETFTKQIATNIYATFKKAGNVELKNVVKRFGSFVKGFLDSATDIEYELMDKHVLLIDDIMSSGSTMSEMVRITQGHLASSITGVVIFNRVSSKE